MTSSGASFSLGLRLLVRSERIVAALLVVSIIVNAMLQTAALFGVLPIIQAVVDPASLSSGRLGRIVQSYVGDIPPNDILLWSSLALAAVVIAKTVYGWLHAGWISRFSSRCEVRVASEMLRRVLFADYDWIVRQNSTWLKEIIFGHTVHWSRDFVRNVISLMNDVFSVIMVFAVVILASPTHGIGLLMVLGGLAGAMFIVVRPRLYRLAELKRRGLHESHVVLTEVVGGVKEVKIAGVESGFVDLFKRAVAEYAYCDARSTQWRIVPRLTLEFVVFGGIATFGILAGSFDFSRGGAVALLALYGLAALRVMPVLNSVVSTIGSVINSRPLIEEIHKTIADTRSSIVMLPKPAPQHHCEWSIVRFDNVGFTYVGSTQAAVSEIQLQIERGKSYGIVGPSGAGKSTLIDLIVGLIAPSAGRITIDGAKLEGAQVLEWRQHFGYVAQAPFLLDATIAANVRFMSADPPDDARLNAAIERSCLAELVRSLPLGPATPVGEKGATLSGGQRQRIAIARALYARADTLILDEPTSALDTLVERDILQSLNMLRGRMTTLVVSHRLGLVRDCDEIWVIERGRLIARGNHVDLVKSCDLYQRMVVAQQELAGADRNGQAAGPVSAVA